MAVSFQLYPIGTNELIKFSLVDEAMCKHFNAPCGADDWYRNWYNRIGFAFACGNDFAKTREIYPEDTDIINWIENNYEVVAWR